MRAPGYTDPGQVRTQYAERTGDSFARTPLLSVLDEFNDSINLSKAHFSLAVSAVALLTGFVYHILLLHYAFLNVLKTKVVSI